MSTRSATANIRLDLQSTLEHTLEDSQVASCTIGQSSLVGSIANGVEAGQANRAWEDRDIELASGSELDIDLYDFAGRDIGAGMGRDGLGQTLTLEEIVCLAIKKTAGSGSLEVMPSSPSGAVTWIPTGYASVVNGSALKTGGVLLWVETDTDAFDVQDGVSHKIRFKANGGSVTFDIMVLGRHDDELSTSSAVTSSSSLSTSSANSSSSSQNSSSSESSLESSSSTSSQSSSSTSSESSSSSSSTST